MKASVNKIFIAKKAGSPMQSIETATLVSGKGIKGDRYFNGTGTFSEKLKGNPAVELSLIEKEEIDFFNATYQQHMNDEDFRRNIVTQGIRLNELVDKTFKLGNLTLKGIRLCEPCAYIAETVNTLLIPHLVGRGGLRAQIISGGEIKINDVIKTI